MFLSVSSTYLMPGLTNATVSTLIVPRFQRKPSPKGGPLILLAVTFAHNVARISTLEGWKSKSDTDIFDQRFNGRNSILDSSELFEIGGLMANI